ncbi:hypothetical protein [Chitinophaga solisilvae]|uniref:hypothetical protein n=1 Tax=Chitinophaga solisilvae TaxID=1233460 RepID=UPI00136F0293|nr:hypothetical protein [Chitinophaga solisilvae]
MSKQISDIASAMASFAARYGPAAIIPAVVKKINADDTVQVVLSSGLELDDVRMKSVVENGGKVLLVPKAESTVQIARIENSDDYVIVSVHEVSRILYVIETSTLDMDDRKYHYEVDKTVLDIDKNGYFISSQGESLRKVLEDLLAEITRMRFTTQNGPTIELINRLEFEKIKERVKKLLKDA